MMKVMKFGGTSVGNAKRMTDVAGLVNDGDKNIVVLSAMSGDTNTLLQIADEFERGELVQAFAKITGLYEKYTETIKALITDRMTATVVLGEIDNHLAELPDLTRNEIVAKGEIISTTLMHYYLMSLGVKSSLLPALVFMRTKSDGSPDYEEISSRLTPLYDRIDSQVIITQGFICRDSEGEVSNLERGGSDFTATIIGSVLKADEIQIWTDIDGIHNNDPRYVDGTTPIRHLSHSQASALAFFGAKILHPLCIEPAKNANVPVRLLNTLDPSAPGSLIDSETAKGTLLAVSARDGRAISCGNTCTISFAGSNDSYSFVHTGAVPGDVAVICVVGAISRHEVEEMLQKDNVEPVCILSEEENKLVIIKSKDKIPALKAIGRQTDH